MQIVVKHHRVADWSSAAMDLPAGDQTTVSPPSTTKIWPVM
jgi:hypothetical protein